MALSITTARRVIDGDDRELESRATFDNRWLTLGYCTPAVLRSGELDLAPCALARVGITSASGTSFETNAAASSVFAAFGLGARLSLALSANLALALGASLELHAARPRLVYVTQRGGTANLHTASLFGAAAELSIAFTLF